MASDRSKQAVRDQIFVRKRRMGLPAVFSIGDSWFDYPIYNNIIDLVDDTNLCAMKRHEMSGALLEQVIHQIAGPEALAPFGARILLMSAGGNDLVVKSWLPLLFNQNVGQPTAGLINQHVWDVKLSYFQGVFGEIVAKCVTHGVTLVVHGYDWLIPTGDGVTFDQLWRGEPWVLPSMLAAGITNPAVQRELGRRIVNDLNDLVLAPLELTPPLVTGHPAVRYVDCRGSVSPDSEWANELHPSKIGFQEVAARFVPELQQLLQGVPVVAGGGGVRGPGQ